MPQITDKPVKAQIKAPTYAMGIVLVMPRWLQLKPGNTLVAVKAHKEFRTEIGSDVSIFCSGSKLSSV